MIEKPQPDLLTLSTTFYDLSFSRNLFSKSEMRQFGASGTEGLSFQICEQKGEPSISPSIFPLRTWLTLNKIFCLHFDLFWISL